MKKIALVYLLGVVLALSGADDALAFSNGKYPLSELSQVRHPSAKVYLARGGAASSFNTFSICSERQGRAVYLNGPNSGYRRYGPINVYGTQQWFFAHRPPLAAFPGTSNHGRAQAGDWNPAGIGRLRAVGGEYRWRKVEAFSEPWHWNYVGGWSRPDPGLSSRTPLLERGSGGTCLTTDVREVQRWVGVEQDGGFGASTETALKKKVAELLGPRAAHGKVTPAIWTLVRTKAKSSPVVALTLRPAKPAVRGTHVRAVLGQLNIRLRELGSSTRVQITDAYGLQAQKAMAEFQTRSKLPATAAVGPATLKALRTPSRAADTITTAVDQAAPKE